MALRHDTLNHVIILDAAQQDALSSPEDTVSEVPDSCAAALLDEVHWVASDQQASIRSLTEHIGAVGGQNEHQQVVRLVEEGTGIAHRLLTLCALQEEIMLELGPQVVDDIIQRSAQRV